MNHKKLGRAAGLVTLVASLSALPSLNAIAEQELEEVVVTGSYLKRSAADSPSPLSVVTSADIEDLGAADVSEIIQAMPWASGSQSRAATFQGGGADGQNSLNLRNLGHGSTLPLVNGKRNVASWYNGRGNASVNVNGLIPNIALERIEIVKDGASALYGSDAVAGVVNFITKKDFEGMDFSAQFTTDEETGKGDATQVGVLWGVQGDRGGIVVSASILNRDEINVDDNYSRYGGTSISFTGQPGRLSPIAGQNIVWAANGLRPGQVVDSTIDGGTLPRNAAGTSFGQADVNCEDSAALERGGALGVFLDACIYDYGSFFAIQAAEQLRKMHVDGHYDFNSDITVYFEFGANESNFDRLNSLNPNAPALTIPTATSYFDAAGNPQTAANPGSVEDAFRRGIVPIQYANLTRLIGGTRNTPASQRPLKSFTTSARTDQRYLVGATWDINEDWAMDVSYTASQHISGVTQAQDTLSSHMELALNGFGGNNCDPFTGTPGEGNAAYAASGGDYAAGECYFFNPFGNSQFDRNGNFGQTDLTLVNPDEIYQWLQGRASSDLAYKQRVIDLVVSGSLVEMPAGDLGLAVGFQRRRDTGSQIYDSALTSGNLDFAFGATDWSGALTTTAYFAELGVPVLDNLQVNLAIRYEDFDELGLDTTDPKLTVLWQPTDSLSLRASAGSSFRVPSLQQTFGSLTTVANQDDVVGGTAFKPSITQGNPALQPESADSYNFGVSWIPQDGMLEGLSVDLDYYNYDYEDIITRESSNNILTADNNAITAFIAANPGLTAIDAVNAGVGNRRQVIRNSQAFMVRLLPDFSNANGATINGVDLSASYRFSTSFGDWKIGTQAAFVTEYEVEVPNGTASPTIIDGVGNYNSTNPVARPLPELQMNATINWSMNQHRVFLIAKYVDELESDTSGGARFVFAGTARLAGNNSVADQLDDTKIPSMTTADIQYTYNLGERVGLADSSISFGVQNFTDEEAPAIAVVTAYDPRLHDGRGRVFFLRFGGSL
ncbi:MAG: iron complex outermembrane receptor protein [Candidatus Azotimanducaceae bacterium]|jgi:iron complex outermembrane receptor protein